MKKVTRDFLKGFRVPDVPDTKNPKISKESIDKLNRKK